MSVQTVDKPTDQAPAQPPQQQQSRGEVAVFQKPRLPYHPAIGERFGIDASMWKALVEAVFPGAKTPDSVVLALSYCKARKLDPFKRVVHIVPVWDSERRGYVETVWPGIAEHRTTAFRTKQYAGADPAAYGPMVTKQFTDSPGKNQAAVTIEVTFPEWCQLTVYRMIDGQRVPVPGPRVYWMETYSRRGRSILPNDRWTRAPYQMIEKCAEAAALRRAFPEELGDEISAEEAEGGMQRIGADNAVDITPPRPARTDAAEPEADPVTDIDVDKDGVVREKADEAVDHDDSAAREADLDARYAATVNGRMPDTAEERGEAEDDSSGAEGKAPDPAAKYVLCDADGSMRAPYTAPAFVSALEVALRDALPADRMKIWKANIRTVNTVLDLGDDGFKTRINEAQRFAHRK